MPESHWETVVSQAVHAAVQAAMAGALSDLVLKETRRAMADHEDEMTKVVRESVRSAFTEAFGRGADK